MTKKVEPGLYQHFKGHSVQVLGVGRHSESLEEMVFYKHDSKDFGKDSLRARPVSTWFEHVDREGYSCSRFIRLEDVPIADEATEQE